MCDVIIPAILGLGALALLSGGTGSCNPCAEPVSPHMQSGNYTITIPQLNGEATHAMMVPSQEFAYYPAQQTGYAPGPLAVHNTSYQAAPQAYVAPDYATPGYSPAGYGYAPTGDAPPPSGHYDAGFGANIGVDGQSAVGAGGYVNPGGVGLDANVGGVDASVGLGNRSY